MQLRGRLLQAYCLCKDILEKNDFERGFHSTAQAGLKLMVVPLLQPVLSLHMYLQT